MKYHFTVIIGIFSIINCFGQYEGPVPAITNGYGSFGPHSVSTVNISNDNFPAQDIAVYYPTGNVTTVPTIFFLHGWGGIFPVYYAETIKNLVSNGYAVVYVPYQSFGVTNEDRYNTMFEGFVKATNSLPNIIDTSRVGFYGHSLGGGAVPRISYRLFTEKNWGTNGKFIYCDAPYYSFELGTNSLDDFPEDCKMLTVLWDKDDVNDLRMGMDIFNNISVESEEKDCIIVYPDTVSGYEYKASHSESPQYTTNSVYNAYDYYVTFRLLNALADYTFTGNLTAKNIALGNGSATQTNMGTQLNPLTVTDNPSPIYPESIYANPCNDPINERVTFCQEILLPVELINFRAEQNEMSINLYWQTISELNNDKFEIEKSQDGREFLKIGEIESKGNTFELQDYFFEVKNPWNGNMYYRLKQIDLDGQFEYSQVISVKYNVENKGTGKIYPNPSANQIAIDINENYSEFSISIFDISGKLVLKRSNQRTIDLSGIKKGYYNIQLDVNGTLLSHKLIKE